MNSHLVEEEVARHTGGRKSPPGGRCCWPTRATPTRPALAPLPDPAWRRSSQPLWKFTGGRGRHQPALCLLTRPQRHRHVQSAGERRMDEKVREEGRYRCTAIPARTSISLLPSAAREAAAKAAGSRSISREADTGKRNVDFRMQAPVIWYVTYGTSF
jgi:hypothetical protein